MVSGTCLKTVRVRVRYIGIKIGPELVVVNVDDE